jgi:enoyl-CoA hydratase
MALCAYLVIASEEAQIGRPYSRIWGCYLGGMWIYRLGLAKAKEHALTGRPLSGRRAAEIELINAALPFEELEAEVARRAEELAAIPLSQLPAVKLIVNQAYERMGLGATQTLGPILDGLMRNTPLAEAFIAKAASEGVRAVTEDRDRPFGDYSVAGDADRPDTTHVIDVD